jgi:hypothetical protein
MSDDNNDVKPEGEGSEQLTIRVKDQVRYNVAFVNGARCVMSFCSRVIVHAAQSKT